MATLRLTATLEARGPAAAVLLTDEQVASLGGGKTPAVRFTVGGQAVAGRIGRMGGQSLLGFNKAVRAQLGVEAGDVLDIAIELDAEPRVYDAPPELAARLAEDPAAQAAWDALAPSHRKEHARAITEAKQEATRERRVEKALAQLRSTR